MSVNKEHDHSAAVTQPPTEGVLERLLDANACSKQGPDARSSPQLVTGYLAGLDQEERLLFLADGSSEPPFPVMIATSESDCILIEAARLNRRALIAQPENGGPILVGLLRERVEQDVRDAHPGELRVLTDGKTLSIQAEQQIELRCGKARLLLRADGRVTLSGTYVVSTSRGPNKIRGATITLN